MAADLERCNACICHALGSLFAVASFVLISLAVACVAIFKDNEIWFKLGLAAFGLGGVLAILLTVYACFAMSRSWRLFGCCGVWTSDKSKRIRRRLEQANPYEMRINPLPASTTNVIGMV